MGKLGARGRPDFRAIRRPQPHPSDQPCRDVRLAPAGRSRSRRRSRVSRWSSCRRPADWGCRLQGWYTNGIIAMPSTIKESRAQCDMIRSLAEAAGRTADEVRSLSPSSPSVLVPPSRRPLRRRALRRLAHLSAVLGLRLDGADADRPLTSSQVKGLRPHPGVPQAARTLELASQGLSPGEILAHGVLDVNPGMVSAPPRRLSTGCRSGCRQSLRRLHRRRRPARTGWTPSSTRSSRSCDDAALGRGTTWAPACAITLVCPSSSASTPGS
jgi:hypothetical protein